MSESERLAIYAVVGILGTIVALAVIGAVVEWHGRSIETLHIGSAVTGLIGILGTMLGIRAKSPGQNGKEGP